MPNKKTVVRTNTTPHSVKEVPLKALTFQELWDAYPSGDPYDNSAYKDQCAIRMSVTFHRVGIEMKSFSQKLVKPMPGQPTIGRILLDGKPTATRADELGEWLQLRPIAGLPRQKTLRGRIGSRRLRAVPVSFNFRATGLAKAKVLLTQAAGTLTYGMASD